MATHILFDVAITRTSYFGVRQEMSKDLVERRQLRVMAFFIYFIYLLNLYRAYL